MPGNEYHFITTWRVTATLAEVNDIIGNASDLPRWWPAVYLEAWTNFGSRQDLQAAFAIAYRLAMVNRSLSWRSGLDALPEEYLAEYDGVYGWLQDFLEAETKAGN